MFSTPVVGKWRRNQGQGRWWWSSPGDGRRKSFQEEDRREDVYKDEMVCQLAVQNQFNMTQVVDDGS